MTASKPGNVRGKSGDPNRGTWCTAKNVARAVGPVDMDPFSNPRSHIVSNWRACSLENGDDGFGDGTPGSFRSEGEMLRATADTHVWLQPPYDIVQRALDHYAHTRWTALLRFDPRTRWFQMLYRRAELVLVLWHAEFEPPPGVTASSNTFPHAVFYRRAEDVTDEILRLGFAWRTGNHG